MRDIYMIYKSFIIHAFNRATQRSHPLVHKTYYINFEANKLQIIAVTTLGVFFHAQKTRHRILLVFLA